MHVDLQRLCGEPYEPVTITTVLNQYFHRQDIPIRILKTYLVPNEFHSRFNAISRTYLYRLVVCDNSEAVNESMLLRHLPIQEFNRSLFIRYVMKKRFRSKFVNNYYFSTNTFDLNKVREAADLFVGLHDFRTFMHKSTLEPDKMTRRTIEKLEIKEGQSLWTNEYSWPTCVLDSSTRNYKPYNIVLTGSGFLQRQVMIVQSLFLGLAASIISQVL